MASVFLGAYMVISPSENFNRVVGFVLVILGAGMLIWLMPHVIRKLFTPHKAD